MDANVLTFAPFIAALLGLGLNFGLPIGLPPQPLDPVVERAAPDACLLYLGWAGVATPDPKSENQTELFLAEPEVRKFLKAIDGQLATILKSDGDGFEEQVVHEETPRIVKTLLTHPTAIFVDKYVFNPAGPPDVSAAIVVNAGDDRAALEASLSKLIALLPPRSGAEVAADETIGGIACHRLSRPPGAPELWWGSKGKYVMLAIGKQTLADMIARMSDTKRTPPTWLAETREKLKVDRIDQTFYVNVHGVAQAMGKPSLDATTLPIWKALGGESVRTVSGVAGLNRGGMISRAFVDCGSKPTGILGMLGEKPLTPDDFKSAPMNSTAAAVMRLPLTQVYDSILEIAAPADPAGKEMMEQQIEGFQAILGISLRDHLLGSLGDTICVYGPSAGDSNPLGGLATISVRDHAKFVKVEKALVDFAKAAMAAQPGMPKVKDGAVGGQAIRSLEIEGPPMTPTPTWAITKTELVIGLTSQAVTDYLNRPAPAKSLADVAAVAAVLRRPAGPSMLTYIDLKDSIGEMYGAAQGALPMANAQLAANGVHFAIPPLPALEAVKSHMRPSITLLTRTSGGLMIERVQSVPAVGDAASLAPLLFLGVQRAQEAPLGIRGVAPPGAN